MAGTDGKKYVTGSLFSIRHLFVTRNLHPVEIIRSFLQGLWMGCGNGEGTSDAVYHMRFLYFTTACPLAPLV